MSGSTDLDRSLQLQSLAIPISRDITSGAFNDLWKSLSVLEDLFLTANLVHIRTSVLPTSLRRLVIECGLDKDKVGTMLRPVLRFLTHLQLRNFRISASAFVDILTSSTTAAAVRTDFTVSRTRKNWRPLCHLHHLDIFSVFDQPFDVFLDCFVFPSSLNVEISRVHQWCFPNLKYFSIDENHGTVSSASVGRFFTAGIPDGLKYLKLKATDCGAEHLKAIEESLDKTRTAQWELESVYFHVKSSDEKFHLDNI
jgi:hypothetical protein